MKTIQRAECGHVLRGSASGTAGPRSMLIVGASDDPVRGDPLILDMKRWVFPRSGWVPLVDSHGDLRNGIKSVLGRCDDFEVRTMTLNSGRVGKALLATANFADTEDGEAALQLYRGEYLDSFSASFIPHWDGATSSTTPASQELCEISCVAVPSDINATVLARALRRQLSGSSTAADRAAIARAIAQRVARDDRDHETRADREARAQALIRGVT
jgi:phage head maturation protease